MKYAVTLVAIVAAVVLGLPKMDTASKHRLDGSDPQSGSHHRFDAHVASVNIGQEDPLKRTDADLTNEQKRLKEEFPLLFATKGQIVSFTSAWCGPCRQQKPQIAKLENRFNVLSFDIGTEQGKHLFEYVGGESVPLTVVMVRGEVKKRFDGYTPASTIEQEATDALKEKPSDDKKTSIEVGSLHIDWSGSRVKVNIGE